MEDKPINSKDILNAIDLNKINFTEKKKRGRPKKSAQLLNNISKIKVTKNDINKEQEEDEIILHLPLTNNDLINTDNLTITNFLTDNDSVVNNSEDIDSNDEETKEDKYNDNYKKFTYIIKKLKDENDELKKYISDITPMYSTEVKVYPIDLDLFELNNNKIIPKKTNLNCWWCTYKFDNLPTYLPEKYSDEKFYVSGCFCSFNCAGAYNIHLNDDKVWDRYSLLKQLYYLINKEKIKSMKDIEINIAGEKELLKKYGGPLTIEEFRKNAKILGREYHKLMPPFLPINYGFEEITNSKNNKNLNVSSIFNSSINNDKNIVKRKKPVNNIASKQIDNYIE
jgi:hypothetical protein